MKISIIGLGSVGSAVATAVSKTGLVREMVLFDIDKERARAAADDLGHASAFGFDINITAVNSYARMKDSEIVIIAAGANQKVGQSRNDLLNANTGVIKDIINKLIPVIDKKKTKIIIATNPLDVMVMLVKQVSKLPSENIIGTGTMLDSARFKIILSRILNVSAHSIESYVLGEHGDTSVLNWSSVTVGNLLLEDFCRQIKKPITVKDKNKIDENVKMAAYEIIKGRGATWDGIGAAVSELVRVIVNDERKILTVSSPDKTGFAMSRPCIVGANGIIAILNSSVDKTEKTALIKSANIIKKNFKTIK